METRFASLWVPILFLLMWSSGSIFVKIGLDDASVWSFLAIRAIGSAVILGAVWVAFNFVGNRPLVSRPSYKSIALVLIAGISLQVCYQAFFFLAIDHGLSPGMLAMVLGLQPLLMPIMAGERLTAWGTAAVLLGFVGLVIGVWGSRSLVGFSISGVAFSLLSVLSMSLGAVVQRRVDVHPLLSALMQCLIAAVAFTTIASFAGWEVTPSWKFVMSSLWMVLVVSTGATLLLFYMLSKGSAGKVGVLFYLVPVVTILFDYVVFNAEISWVTAIGALIVVGSVTGFRDGPRSKQVVRCAGGESESRNRA